MPGVLTIERRDFQFDGRSLADDQEVPLSGWVRTGDWASGVLEVRLHTKGSWPSTTATAVVAVQNGLPSPDEPETMFVSATELGSITIANGDAAPKLYQALLDGFGAYARPVLL